MPTGTFLASLKEWGRSQSDAPALSCDGRVISYADLIRLADSMASVIAELSPVDRAPVCLLAEKSPETIARIIACLAVGRRVLLASADLGSEALQTLCAQAGCAYRLSSEGIVPLASAGRGRSTPAEPGILLTTSGSTGVPKPVVLSTDGVDTFLAWAAARFGIGPGVVVLSYAPLNFDLSLLDVWATLAAGGCVELVDEGKAVRGDYLLDLCRRRAPTVIQAVPMFYRLLADASAGGPGLDSVEQAIFTGDAMPVRLLRRLPELFPRAALWNIYGCTETNDTFLHRVIDAELDDHADVPIGRPIDGVDAVVVDGTGAPILGPAVGELLVASPFQASGYLDPRLTDERWREGYFRTGDLVRRADDGLFFLVGRIDHQVKVRGVRVSLPAVEQVILGHPNVLEAAVVAIPDELAGNRLHAIVRRQPRTSLNSLELRTHCAAKLPRTAVPSVVEIVDQPLPRTSTGKVDRHMVGTHPERMQRVD